MTAIEALVLGLVQGIAEFLPVSSSGHLTIGQWLLNRTDVEANVAFDIVVHVATLLVVVVMLRREMADMFHVTIDVPNYPQGRTELQVKANWDPQNGCP